MYIKQLRICGFKSFAKDTRLDFHPGLNVIVGLNGSGKSNLFAAITLILSGPTLTSAEHENIMYNGGGRSQLTSCFVELTLDNSDNRLAVVESGSGQRVEATKTVVIRRELSSKSDKYYVNKRPMTRTDFFSVMSTAGFSRHNQQCLVPQGSINRILFQTEAEKLGVIHELAGVATYREKLLTIVSHLNSGQSLISNLESELDTLTSELGEVSAEQKSVAEYRKLESQRDAIESMNKLEKRMKITSAISEMDAKYQKMTAKRMARWAEMINLELSMADMAEKNSTLESSRVVLAKKVADARDVISCLGAKVMKSHEKLVKSLESLGNAKRQREETLEKYSALSAETEKLDARLKKLLTDRDDCFREISAIKGEIESGDRRARVKVLTSNSLSESRRRRDLHTTNGEVAQIETMIARQNDMIRVTESQMAEKREELQSTSAKLKEAEKFIQTQIDSIGNDGEDCDILGLKRRCREVELKIKQLYEQRHELTSSVNGYRDKIAVVDRQMIGKGWRRRLTGETSLRKVISILRETEPDSPLLAGFYGPVYELVEPGDNRLDLVASLAAGHRLCFAVVDKSETASALLKLVNANKLPGDICFIALDRLQFKSFSNVQAEMRSSGRGNALPLVDRMTARKESDNKCRPFDMGRVLQYVFGRHAVVRDADDLSHMAQTGMDVMTLDGDQMAANGVMRGGYYKADGAAFTLLRQKSCLRQEMEDVERRLNRVEAELSNGSLSDQHKSILAMIGRVEGKRDHKNLRIEQAKSEMKVFADVENQLTRQLRLLENLLASQRRRLLSLESELLDLTKSTSQSDLRPNSASKGCPDDTVVRHRKQQDLRYKLRQLETQRVELDREISALELRMEHELRPRLAELDPILEHVIDTLQQEVACNRGCKESVDEEFNQLNEEVIADRNKLATLDEAISADNVCRDELASKRSESATELQKIDSACVKLDTKIAIAEAELKSCDDRSKVSNLKLSEDEQREFDRMCTNRAERSTYLKSVKAKLSEMEATTNTLAEIEYDDIKSEIERVRRHLSQFTVNQDRIVELKNELQCAKADKLTSLRVQVGRYFSEIASHLLPTLRAELRFISRSDSVVSSSSDTTGISDDSSLDAHQSTTGIRFALSFQSNRPMTDNIGQFSGGQKTLVAISFVLALQRCDPVPFYIWDEIDAALDEGHRAGLANYIAEKRNIVQESMDEVDQLRQFGIDSHQFICTTFKGQMLNVADKCFVISHSNGMSHCHVATNQEALAILDQGVSATSSAE